MIQSEYIYYMFVYWGNSVMSFFFLYSKMNIKNRGNEWVSEGGWKRKREWKWHAGYVNCLIQNGIMENVLFSSDWWINSVCMTLKLELTIMYPLAVVMLAEVNWWEQVRILTEVRDRERVIEREKKPLQLTPVCFFIKNGWGTLRN